MCQIQKDLKRANARSGGLGLSFYCRKFDAVSGCAGHDETDRAFAFFLQMADDAGGASQQGNALQRSERKANVQHDGKDRPIDIDRQPSRPAATAPWRASGAVCNRQSQVLAIIGYSAIHDNLHLECQRCHKFLRIYRCLSIAKCSATKARTSILTFRRAASSAMPLIFR